MSLDNLPPTLLKDCVSVNAGLYCHIVQTADLKKYVLLLLINLGPCELWKIIGQYPFIKGLSRVLEKAVHQQPYDLLDEQSLLSNCQFG